MFSFFKSLNKQNKILVITAIIALVILPFLASYSRLLTLKKMQANFAPAPQIQANQNNPENTESQFDLSDPFITKVKK